MLELTWFGKSGDDKSGTMQVVTNGEPINIRLETFQDFLTIQNAINTAASTARRLALYNARIAADRAVSDLRGDLLVTGPVNC